MEDVSVEKKPSTWSTAADGCPETVECFPCKICGCEFVDQASLSTHQTFRHFKRQQRKYNFRCVICKKQSVTQLGMIKHLNKEHLIIDNNTNNESHTNNNNNIILQPCWDSYFNNNCNNNNKMIICKRNRRRKQSMPRKIVNNKKYGISVKNKFLIELKIKWAEKLWIRMVHCWRLHCSMCYKVNGEFRSFSSKAALELHTWIKHRRKVVECNYCGKAFSRVYQLKLHRRFEHSKVQIL